MVLAAAVQWCDGDSDSGSGSGGDGDIDGVDGDSDGTVTAAVAAMATAMAAVTTINSKEAATAAAEELDDGWDGRRLCSVLFVIFSVA